MKFENEPISIQKALLVATKFGFLRKETFWNFLTTSNISHKYVLWNRLMASGYMVEYNRVGVADNYYGLSKKGIRIMNDIGYQAVSKAHPLHFEHDEIVMSFALACEKALLISCNWSTDRMLRHLLPQLQVKSHGRVFDKLPDLLFELGIENMKLECALEVERSRKSKTRYDSFVLSYKKDVRLCLVLVAYNDRYVVKSIQDAINRLGYPQSTRPIAFCRIKDLLKNPSDFEIEIGANKIQFADYIEKIRAIAAKTPEKSAIKNSAQNYAKSGMAA